MGLAVARRSDTSRAAGLGLVPLRSHFRETQMDEVEFESGEMRC